eukprot:scaffold4036_cov236-Pinguiococcus_pyrenoidosus.AAC.2
MWGEDDYVDELDMDEEVGSEYTDWEASAVADMSELQAALEAVKGQLEVEQRRREDLETQLEDVTYEAERTKEELEEARNDLYAENVAADVAEVAEMKAEITELRQTVAGLKDENLNAASRARGKGNTDKDTLRVRVDALELAQVKNECSTWKTRFETLQEKYQGAVDLIKDLKTERTAAQRELQSAVSNRRREVAALKSRLAQLQAQLQACRMRLRDCLVESKAVAAVKRGKDDARRGGSKPPRMMRRSRTVSSVSRPKTAPSPFRVKLPAPSDPEAKTDTEKRRSWRDPRPNDKPLEKKEEPRAREPYVGPERQRANSFTNLLTTLWHRRDDKAGEPGSGWDECNVSFEQLNDNSGRPQPKDFYGSGPNGAKSEEKLLAI